MSVCLSVCLSVCCLSVRLPVYCFRLSVSFCLSVDVYTQSSVILFIFLTQHDLLPVHERKLQSNYKVDIHEKIKDMEKLSIESIEGDNYLPLQGRNWKPPTPVKKKEEEVNDDVLPEEWKEMLDSANEKDLAELAGKCFKINA